MYMRSTNLSKYLGMLASKNSIADIRCSSSRAAKPPSTLTDGSRDRASNIRWRDSPYSGIRAASSSASLAKPISPAPGSSSTGGTMMSITEASSKNSPSVRFISVSAMAKHPQSGFQIRAFAVDVVGGPERQCADGWRRVDCGAGDKNRTIDNEDVVCVVGLSPAVDN